MVMARFCWLMYIKSMGCLSIHERFDFVLELTSMCQFFMSATILLTVIGKQSLHQR